MSEKRILSLFAVFSLTLHCLRDVYEADLSLFAVFSFTLHFLRDVFEAEFVAICCILVHFAFFEGCL